MTTIAANRKEMAADTKCVDNSNSYYADKIVRIRGSIVGCAGDAALTTRFLAWFRKECPADEVEMTVDEDHAFEALVLDHRGLWLYHNVNEADRIHDKHYAIGTGNDHACTAMDLGLNPHDAVKQAIRRDCHSGGKITVLALEPKKVKKSKKQKSALPPVAAADKQPKEENVEASPATPA